MKLRSISLDIAPACADYGIDLKEVDQVRRCTEVLSWILGRWVKAQKLELPNAGHIQIFASSERKGSVFSEVDAFGKRVFVGVVASAEQLTKKRHIGEIYRFLFSLVGEAVQRIQDQYGIDISRIGETLERFYQEGFEARAILAERRPRGLGLTFRIEGLMTDRAFSAWFVALKNKEEIHREAITQTSPFLISRYGDRLSKIDFDGKAVSIPGSISTFYLGEELRTTPHGTVPGPFAALHHYEWCRSLSEIV